VYKRYIITPYIHVQCMYAWYWLVDISCICHVFFYFKWILSIFTTTRVFAWYYYHMKICISLQQFDQTIYEGVIALFHQKHCMCSFYILNGNSSENYMTFHRCSLPSFSSFGWGVSEGKIKIWKVNGRHTTSDGKSSHCLWQGELKIINSSYAQKSNSNNCLV
jgi:hypothetical protein